MVCTGGCPLKEEKKKKKENSFSICAQIVLDFNLNIV